MINLYTNHGALSYALHLLSVMRKQRIQPNVITFTALVKGCAIVGTEASLLLAEDLFAEMQQRTNHFSSYIAPNILTYYELLQAYLNPNHYHNSHSHYSIPPEQHEMSQYWKRSYLQKVQRIVELVEECEERGLIVNNNRLSPIVKQAQKIITHVVSDKWLPWKIAEQDVMHAYQHRLEDFKDRMKTNLDDYYQHDKDAFVEDED
jgi:hypothetical protein